MKMKIIIKEEKIQQKGLQSQIMLLPEAIAKLLSDGADITSLKQKDLWNLGDAKKYVLENKNKLFKEGFKYKILTVFPRGVRMAKDGIFTANEEPIFYADEMEYSDPIADDEIIGFIIYRIRKAANM